MTFRSSTAGGEVLQREYSADDRGSFSVIDRFSVFDGTFRAERDLRIEGEVKGMIDCHGTLFVAEGSVVAAKVEAENITVAGDLSGEIQCRGRLHLLPSGRLRGKVNTAALVISEGALYEGELEMPDGVVGPAPAAAERPGPVPVPTPQAVTETTLNGGESTPMPSTFIRRLGGPETPWEENSDPPPTDSDSSS